jgi:FAD/FMN-containing dehydrogenase
MEKNETCYLNGNKSEPCGHGRVSLYSAVVTSVEQIQKTVKFAKKNNLRVIVRNTGHDFSGKSSPPNSL